MGLAKPGVRWGPRALIDNLVARADCPYPVAVGGPSSARLVWLTLCARRYAKKQGCRTLVLGPWASTVALATHLAQCAYLNGKLPAMGINKRHFQYYDVGCPDADRIDPKHVSKLGAQQLLDSGLGRRIIKFIRDG